jgi:hypothetical protein
VEVVVEISAKYEVQGTKYNVQTGNTYLKLNYQLVKFEDYFILLETPKESNICGGG